MSPLSKDGVFINCPFDDAFAATFRAIVFTIFACGFRPRSARELEDGSQARLDKLYGIIEECRYGVHDLSRTQLNDSFGLPRFNMPLELGIFLGAKRFGGARHRDKRVMILDVDRYRYQRFISDLAGMDIHEHGGDSANAVRRVRDWLANVSRRRLPGAERVVRLQGQFEADLPALAAELDINATNIPTVDLEAMMVGWLT